MSWSVSATGKAPAVASKIAAEISRSKCIEPEEGVKQAVGAALAAALAAQDPEQTVKVSASGHQGGDAGSGTKISNTLHVSVEPF
jgi:hypothetical protein